MNHRSSFRRLLSFRKHRQSFLRMLLDGVLSPKWSALSSMLDVSKRGVATIRKRANTTVTPSREMMTLRTDRQSSRKQPQSVLSMFWQMIVGSDDSVNSFRRRLALESLEGRRVLASFTISDLARFEGDAGPTAYTFTISRDNNTNAESVDWSTSNGTAFVADGDYTAVPATTVSFAAGGALTANVVVNVTGDTKFEINESFAVNLTNPTGGAVIADAQGIGVIGNDDTTPTISVTAVPNNGVEGATATFVVALSAESGVIATAFVETQDGTALGTSDYNAGNVNLTFNPGQTSIGVLVSTNDDNLPELNETFNLVIGATTGISSVVTGSATYTINNNDTVWTIDGTAAADLILLRRNGANYEVQINGGAVSSIPIASVGLSAIHVNGLAGNDTLDIDFAGGTFSIPINYDGGTQTGTPGDTLRTFGGNFATGISTPSSSSAGAIAYAGGTTGAATINYAGLEPIDDLNVVANYVINGTAAVDTINVVNGPVAGQVQVNSGVNNTFERINFANKTAVTINATQGGADNVLVNFTANATALTSLNVLGGGSADTINVQAAVVAVATTINGGGGLDNINVGNSGVIGTPGLLTPIASAVNVDGGAGGANLVVDGSGAGVNADYTITSTTVTRSLPAGFGGVTYSNLSNLLLTVGSGANVISVNSTAAGVATNIATGAGDDSIVFANGVSLNGGTIDGGANNDTVDYSAYTTSVAVNLGSNAPGGALAGVVDGGQENPGQVTTATGTVSITNYNSATKTFDISAHVSNLLPGAVTGYHIHRAPIGVNGGIIVDLVGIFGLGSLIADGLGGFDFNAIGVTLPAQHEAAFLGGITYFNVHTATAPGGLLRGQILPNAVFVAAPGTATGTSGISNIENATGGTGADSLVGDLGVNVLLGNQGNDTIVGAPGNDTMNGGDNNDVLVWSNGDNNDIIDGALGVDVVQVNGSIAGGDNFTVGVAGTRVAFARTNLIPFTLDIGTAETLIVNGAGGDDTETVNSLAGVADLTAVNLFGLNGNDTFNTGFALAPVVVNVNGGSHTTGDTLNVDAAGGPVTDNGVLLTKPGFSPINYTQIESLSVINVGDVTITGTGADDTLVVNATSANSGSYKLNGGPTITFAGMTKLTFNASAGSDSLTINNPIGGLFAPVNGIDYNGGGQTGDALNLLGGGSAAFDETYFVGTTTPPVGGGGNSGDGLVRFTGPTPVDIRFTGLAPIVDTVVAASLTVNSTDAANTISVTNAAVAPRVRVAVDAFEPIDFDNKTALIINAGDGALGGDSADNILVSFNFAPSGLTNITINADEGADIVSVTGNSALSTLAVNGGDGLDSVNIGNTGAIGAPGLLTPIAGAVTVNGNADGANLVVDGSGAGVAADYAITSTTVTRSLPPGFGGVTYSNLSSLLLTVGSGANVISVNSTAAGFPTNIATGAGNDSIVFANGVSLNGGTVDGGADSDTLDYSAFTTGVSANLGLNVSGLAATLAGDQEVPANASTASGTGTITNYNPATRTFDISVTVNDLAPASVTGFHIHRGAFGVNGPVIVDFSAGPLVAAGTGFTFNAVGVSLSAVNMQDEAALLSGTTYLNVHTATFPGGIIRGQLFSNGNVGLASGRSTGTGGVTGIENAIGGSAADGLVGTTGVNSLQGNAGNDVLLGGPGNDNMQGGNDNDILVWSNGDNTDVIDGNAGTDIVSVNGAVAPGDVFTVTSAGTRVAFARTNLVPFGLDIGTVERLIVNGVGGDDSLTSSDMSGVADLTTLDLNGQLGNDTFNAAFPAPATLTVNVKGGPHGAGDTLNLDAGGGPLTDSGTQLSKPGVNPINYAQIENLAIANIGDVVITGSGIDDVLVVNATSASAGNYKLNAGPVISFTGMTKLTFNSAAGSDGLTINNPAAGGLFAPTGGIDYNGGGQAGDLLNLLGGGAADLVQTYFVGTTTPPIGVGPGNNGDGLLRFIGSSNVDIRFTGLAPIVDTVLAASLTVNSTDAANNISVTNGAAPRLIVAVDAFETIEFNNKSQLIVNGGDGAVGGDAADTILLNFNNLPAGLTGITINANEGADAVSLQASSNLPVTLNGGDGLDIINVGNKGTLGTPGLLTPVAGPVFVNGGAGGANLTVDGTGAAVAADYAITATTVTRSLPSGFGGVTYSNLTSLLLATGSGPNVVTVSSTSVPTTADANAGIDTLILNPTNSISVYEQAGNYGFELGTPGGLTALDFENINLQPGNGVLNIVGDEGQGTNVGGGGVDEADLIEVVGTAQKAGALRLAHAGAFIAIPQIVQFAGVTNLNVNTFDLDDDVTIDPFASTTQSWNIVLNVNSGTGDDDITYGNASVLPVVDPVPNGSAAGVSENVTVTPTLLPGAGEIAVPGVVTIHFQETEDLSFLLNNGVMGDTDTLTIRGTDNNLSDAFTIRPDAAGNDADPLVDLDVAAGQFLQIENIAAINPGGAQFFVTAINFEGLGGSDTFDLVPSASGTILNIDGGNPTNNPLASDVIVIPATAGVADLFTLTPGATADAGAIASTINGTPRAAVSFKNVEGVNLELGGGAAADVLTMQGTGGNNAFTLVGTGASSGTARVDAGPLLTFTGLGSAGSDINLVGLGGDDLFSVTHFANWQVDDVNIDGGAPSASDAFQLSGTGGIDGFNYTANSANGGQIDLTSGGPTTNYILTSIESAIVDGLAAVDTLNVATLNSVIIPGINAGEGTVQPVDSAGAALLALSYVHIETVVVTGGTAVIQGTEENDTISVSAVGVVTITNNLGFSRAVDVSGFNSIVINALGGDDTITITPSALFAGGISVIGGTNGNGSDSLSLSGADLVIDLETNLVTGVVGGPVNFNGIEHLNVTATATITVNGKSSADQLSVTPTGANTAKIVPSIGGLLSINTTNPGSLTINTVGGSDTVIVNGTSSNDSIGIARTATAQVTVGALKVIQVSNSEALRIASGDGNDTINVTGTGSSAFLVVDGGLNTTSDTLVVTNLTAGTTTYTPGSTSDSGTLATPDGGIQLLGTELISIAGSAAGDTLTANGTHGNDTIALQFLGGANRIWINGQSVISFSSFGTVNLNGRFGDDKINVLPIGLVGVTTINVNGGDPTVSDELLISGTPAADTVTVTPTGIGAGTVVIGATTIAYNTTEKVTYSGLGGGDSVNVVGTAGNDTFTSIPGAANDAGQVLLNGIGGLNYTGLGVGTLIVTGNGGADTLVANGTDASDTVGVLVIGAVTVNSRIAIGQTAITNLRLNTGDGDDTINIAGTQPYTTILVDAGNPSASDVVNLTGAAGAVAINFANNTVTGYGGVVSLIGVELLNANANGNNLDVNATNGDDNLIITPTSDGGVTAQLTTAPTIGAPVVNASNIGAFMINFLAGSDNLAVVFTQFAETITVTGTSVSRPGLETVNYTGAVNLRVDGRAGNDTFNVTPSAATTIFIDGGNPVGPVGDTLTLTVPVGAGTTTYAPGPENDEGGFSFSGGVQPVSFDHIEAIGEIDLTLAGGVLIINGTNADNDINIVGTAANAFTVSIDGGPAVLYSGATSLTVNALAGDDDIDLTVGPLAITSITINGNDPTASDNLLIVGTAGLDVVAFTSTSPSSGSLTGLNTPVNFTTTEHVVYDGNDVAALDVVTINGTFTNDSLTYDANSLKGNFRSFASPDFDTLRSVRIVVNGGAGGVDVVNLLGSAGADTVTSAADAITINTPGSLAIITLGAGIDAVTISTLGNNDNINLSGITVTSTVFGGDGNDTIVGSPQVDSIYGGAGNDILVGGAGNDFEYGEDGNDIFGNLTLTPDGVADDAGADQAFGGAGFDNFVWEPGDGADSNNGGGDAADIFRFFGNAAANVFTLRQGGTPTHFNALIGALVIDNHGIEDVIVDGQGGGDTFVVEDLYATEVVSINLNLNAADAGALDPVTVNGRNVADNLVVTTTGVGALSIQGLRYNVNLTNAEATDTLTINVNDGDDQVTVAPGAEAVLIITLNGNNGGDLLTGNVSAINGGAGNDTLIGGASNQTMDGGAGDDTFVGNGGTDNIGGGSSVGDTILVSGTSGNDTIDMTLNGVGHLVVTVNGLTTTYANFVGGPIASSGIEQILVQGFAGNDTLTVDSANGAIPILINFDGGNNADLLTLTGGVATSDIYQVGPNTDQGTSTIVIGGVTQIVRFNALEPVLDLVAGPLVVVATNANNAINYSQGSVAANGLVSIDGFETIAFSNKTTLTINALAGSDTINLNNPSTPTGLTAITVNGGDPTASDILIVNGSTGNNAITYTTSDTIGSGSVAIAGFATVDFTTVESLVIDGQGGTDDLTFATPAGGHRDTFTPGTSPDSGTIRSSAFGGGTQSVPLTFSHIGALGNVTIAGGGAGSDIFEVNGTNSIDTFALTGTSVQILNATGGFTTNFINTPGVFAIELRGLDGDDRFNVSGSLAAYSGGVVVDGGNPSASDVLNIAGNSGLITQTFGTSTVSEVGSAVITYSGIEIINVDAANANFTVRASSSDDSLEVTPSGANAATFRLTKTNPAIGSTPIVNGSRIGTLNVDLLAGNDELVVIGSVAAEAITVTGALVTIGALETVNYIGTEALSVFGRQGSDTFTVTPGASPIFIDGGDPIGILPGDQLIVNGGVGFFPGPENDEGGVLTGGGTVSFDHIESLTIAGIVGCPFLIVGTNGDDDITVIARDASTTPGADGVQDFTFSINAGINVVMLNQADLFIDAMSGDDDIVIRTAAPNEAAWDVNVRVAGGSPSIGAPLEADRLVLETPNGLNGFDDIVFNPTGNDTGNLVIDKNANGTYEAAGTDSLITFGSFTMVCPPANFIYTSTAGGVELIQVNGEGAPAIDDNLTINGTALNDTTVINPTGIGTGSFASGASPQFIFQSFDNVTVNPGAGGFDHVEINGTAGPDTVTSTANTVTLGGAVTLGAGIDQVDINTFDGNDSVTLTLALTGLKKVVNLGAGNDVANLSGVAVDPADPVIYGGDGDDNIIGSPNPDLIFGGSGTDVILGLGGIDYIDGGDGNDTITGGTGDDTLHGGAGSDVIIWNNGDNTDVVEGGTGDDRAVVTGAGAGDIFTVFANATNPSRIAFNRTNLVPFALDIAEVEEFDINSGSGADNITVGDLTTTALRELDLDVGVEAGIADTVTVSGRNTADQVQIVGAGSTMTISGLRYDVRVINALAADADDFTFNANGGDDSVLAAGSVATFFTSANTAAANHFRLNGGDGQDRLEGYGSLDGQAGNDTLIGSATIAPANGSQLLIGGDGDDTMVGGAGADTFDGGIGFDTILVRGTPGNDVIDISQTADVTLVETVNGVAETDTLVLVAGTRTVERVSVVADAGNDTIRVQWADSLGTDANVNSLRVDVDGGAGSTGDRLGVVDLGTGDLILYERGTTNDSGAMAIGTGNAEALIVNFSDIEVAQPIPGAGGDVVVFKHDPYEFNNARTLATYLGASESINVDPTINPGLDAAFGFPADEDWFRVVAEKTGVLDFQVYFRQVATVPSGRPGLPNAGNLDIAVTDAAGNVVTGFGINDNSNDERIRIPAIAGQTYYLRVFANGNALNTYNITVDNYVPPTPRDMELLDNPVGDPPPANSDTGRSQFDNITRDNTPTLVFRLDDAIFLNDLPGNNAAGAPPDEVIPIPFQAAAGTAGYRIAIFDEGSSPLPGNQTGTPPQTPIGFATFVSAGVYQFTTPVLTDGTHFLSARVQMVDPATPQQAGFGDRSVALEVIVDTVIPPAFFGQISLADSTQGLGAASDTGVAGVPATFADRVTSDTRPSFYGRAEANTIVRLYAESNGVVGLQTTGGAPDLFLGLTTATPLDGTNQFPGGQWSFTTPLDLNNPALGFTKDGVRVLYSTGEDVAGNTTTDATADVLNLFLDTSGPQITGLQITGSPAYNLFGIKPGNAIQGPTPKINGLTINVRDLPNRSNVDPNFLYAALQSIVAVTPGNFILTGDHNGIIAIQSITFIGNPASNGNPATGSLALSFFEPLPDDRFTLTVKDTLVDLVGNKLDGESNAAEPLATPTFPTGDGQPGRDFVARFTVDSRPEVGVVAEGIVYVDINGNFVWDPEGKDRDATNRDLVFQFGQLVDAHFAGNFAPSGAVKASGFDKLGAYGKFAGNYSFVLDTNDDGVADFSSLMPIAYQVNGIPVAGNFSAAHPGDEIGLFDGSFWYMDTNGNNQIDLGERVASNFNGLPIVGDFNGDGTDDLAAFNNATNIFTFDTNRDGIADFTWKVADDVGRFVGLSGFTDRPVAGDLNLDGIDDIGLWVKDRQGTLPRNSGEYFFWVSDQSNPNPGLVFNSFSPDPLGNDLFAEFGDEFGLPIFGNFDPPVGNVADSNPLHNTPSPLDVDSDGFISPLDALIVVNVLNNYPKFPSNDPVRTYYTIGQMKADPDNDRTISPLDVLNIINYLNSKSKSGAGEGEADSSEASAVASVQHSATDDFFAQLGADLENESFKKKRR